jgi:hypothetical protein
MLKTDPETGDVTYEFPITLYNRSGGVYAVDSLDALRYHQDNGWSIEVPEQDVPRLPADPEAALHAMSAEFMKLKDVETRLETLEKLVKTLHSSLASAHAKITKLNKEQPA